MVFSTFVHRIDLVTLARDLGCEARSHPGAMGWVLRFYAEKDKDAFCSLALKLGWIAVNELKWTISEGTTP